MSNPDDVQINRVIELMFSNEESSYEELSKMLEDSITKKCGSSKCLSNLRFKREEPQIKLENHLRIGETKRRSQDDPLSGRNSDNELVLTLLKDDLMCVTCKDMDVSAGNQLIECTGCHALYHQECHSPYILDSELNTNWVCSGCKYRAKKASKHSSPSSSSSSSSSKSTSTPGGATTTTSTSAYPSSKLSSPKQQYTSNSGGRSPSSSHSNSSSPTTSVLTSAATTTGVVTSGRIVVPNINIVSANADKRLQIMKRKAAAKIQEKRSKPKT